MQHLINTGLLSSSTALIASSFIYIINNINTKEIERKLMSNFQKIRYSLSISLISAFSSAVLMIIWTTIKSGKPEYNLTIGLFIATLSISIVVLLVVEICFIFILRNRKYEIIFTDGSEWEIIKTTNGKGLLLKQGNKYKIIKDYDNMPIKESR